MNPIYALTALTLLTACATLSEDECRAGDWSVIGFEDGAQGRAADFIGNHREACAEYGIAPDLSSYLAGREQGLARYCTPQRAYELGRAGRPVANVCPAVQMQTLSDANFQGREYRRLSDEIARLRRDIDEYDETLATLDPDREDAVVLRRSLGGSINAARFEILRLQARRSQFETLR